MSFPIRASFTFLRRNVLTKVKDGTTISQGLQAQSTHYPNLPIPVADLLDVNFRLQTANIAAGKGDKAAIIAQRAIETEWIDKFRETAAYVSFTANGNAELIQKTGFTPTKGDRKKKAIPAMLTNLKVAPAAGKGACKISCDGEAGTNGYVAVAAPEDVIVTLVGDMIELNINGKKVYVQPTSRRTAILKNLTSRETLCVSMLSFNSAGSSPLAPSIEVTPQ